MKEENYISIAKKLRTIRKNKGLKINEVANKVGCSPSAVSMYERGERNIKIERLLDIIKFYELDIEQFINENKDQIGVKMTDVHKILELKLKDRNEFQVENKVSVRADGICELCGKIAPFMNKCGKPYLEMYELNPGEQKSEFNIVALCPNCKAKMKMLNLKGDYLYLKNKIQENR